MAEYQKYQPSYYDLSAVPTQPNWFYPPTQQPTYQQQNNPLGIASDVSSLRDAYSLSGLGGTAAATNALGGTGAAVQGGAGTLTAPGALTPGAVTTAPLGSTAGATGGATSTGLFSGFGTGGASAGTIATGVGAMAAPFLAAIFAGKHKPSPSAQARIDANARGLQYGIDTWKNSISDKYNMSYKDWIAENIGARPLSPVQQAEMRVGTGEDNMDKGDQGYQMEELANDRYLWDVEMPKYWADNPDWFFPDGTPKIRTQEGLDAMNYFASQNRGDPMTDAQRQDAISKGLNPEGMFDMDAARGNYLPIWAEGDAAKYGWTDNGRTIANVSPSIPSPAGGGYKQPSIQSIDPVTPGLFGVKGNIYGEGVPRQTYQGRDLYADQTLYKPRGI